MEEKYIKCKHCGIICNLNSSHIEECIINWNDLDGIQSCYTCGKSNSSYSKKQLELGFRARCINCVKKGYAEKYAPFIYCYKKLLYDNIYLDKITLNKQLEYYVKELDVDKVKELLIKGANPNYHRQETVFLNTTDREVYLWTKDGEEIMQNEKEFLQPITPLRLCVFYLSNCLFTWNDIEKLYSIGKLLIEYGADKKDALLYFNDLYGEHELDKVIDFYKMLL